jgi:1,4-dihydroxy-6-naphthoate synthase
MEIQLGHSPDADDAFMFYPLERGLVSSGPYRFRHEMQDIETLNRRTLNGELHVSAVSIHVYPYIQDRYALLSCGASVGVGYGPVLVTRGGMSLGDLVRNGKVAVPGELTSAYLALRLMVPSVSHCVLPFDRIQKAVARGEVEGGLLIHEGQLTYGDDGLQKLVDLGEWWMEETGLPLPLGGNVVRRDLGTEHARAIGGILRASFEFALANRDQAVDHAMSFARGLTRNQADSFVGMYVNEYTLDYGPKGRAAVERLLEWGHEAGIVDRKARVDFVD